MKRVLAISALVCIVLAVSLLVYLPRPKARPDTWGDIFVGYVHYWDESQSKWVRTGNANCKATHTTEGWECHYWSEPDGWYSLCNSDPSMEGVWRVSATKVINGVLYGDERLKYYDGGEDPVRLDLYMIQQGQ